MATCAMRTGWRASAGMWKSSSIYQRTLLNAHVYPNAPNSIITLTQKRSLFVLPFGLDVGLVGFAAYYLTKLKKPEPQNVLSIFGPDPWGKESQQHPEKVVRCIAHRGAALDAPENTMEAFKYCVEHDCNIIELDVRASRDGKLILLHDEGLERLTGTDISSVRTTDWDRIKDIDVGSTHPNRKQFKDVRLCLLDDALDYLLANNVKIIIDVKGEDKQVIAGILSAYASRPALHQHAAVTCFNPFVLYQARADLDAFLVVRFGDNLALHGLLRVADSVHALVWRWAARWCAVSAVLLHKDIVSASEIHYWRWLGIRCAGWCVNRPLEKLYWRGVLKSPYLANTLLGEPDVEGKRTEKELSNDRPGPLVDKLLEPERKLSSGQN
ncbi:glycerophosphodiester phosphodiesterase 1-like [Spodoptera litura]|uniref:Glycerophosphodiester phosphodiesterase 1-like n=1 Tax=Spodoptera litura TaxID=69820 RepID=A0A9J7IL55_SPOLT|nr:glycerophosphodiester phosphodiesterase 1-like [Spodoptera litura]